ncbi:Uncharacterised protein [uncultured archaeon]|nr:Uncharacterised protein [uncultured archaeon]
MLPAGVFPAAFAATVLIFFTASFSGCIDVPTKEARLECLELSSYPFPNIPECSTTERCFSEAETAFRLNLLPFSHEVASELFSAKGHVASSWLFMNRAKETLQDIRSECNSGSFAKIPQMANELRANLLSVAKETDLFSEKASKSILVEVAVLEGQDINLVRNQPLFDDFILLNQNIIDFSRGNSSSETYAAVSLREEKKLNGIAEKLGMGKVIPEKSVFSLLAENDSRIAKLSGLKEKDFPISLLLPVFSGASQMLDSFIGISDSVGLLKRVPPSEVFEAVSGIIGKESSAAGEFFAMFRNDSGHRLGLAESNREEAKRARTLLASLGERAKDVSEKSGGAGRFSAAGIPRDFIRRFNENASRIEAGLRSAEEADFLKSSTPGKVSWEIFRQGLEADSLAGEVAVAEEKLASASGSCAVELESAKAAISSKGFSSSGPVAAALREKLSLSIERFEKTGEFRHCEDSLETFSELSSAIESGAPEEFASKRISDCFSKCSGLLAFDSSGEATARLGGMMRIERPYNDPLLLLDSCRGLISVLEQSAKSGHSVARANSLFSEASQKTGFAKYILENFECLASGKKAEKIIGDFASASEKFEGGLLKLDGVSPESAAETSKLLEGILFGMDDALPLLAREAFECKASVSEAALPGFKGKCIRIALQNNGLSLPLQFSANLPIPSQGASTAFSTGNVSFVQTPDANKTEFNFSSLAAGINSIIICFPDEGDAADANAPGANSPVIAGDGNSLRLQDSNGSNGSIGGFGSFPDENAFGRMQAAAAIISGKDSIIRGAAVLEQDRNALVSYGLDIEMLALSGKLEQAGKALNTLREKAKEMEARKADADSVKAGAAAALGAANELSTVSAALSQKTTLIERNFSELTKGELDSIYPFLPISQARLKELRGIADDAEKHSGLAEKISAFLDSGRFADVSKLAEKEGLAAIVASAKAANEEAGKALEAMESSAASSYAAADAIQKNTGAGKADSEAGLLNAKLALERKSYLKSILASNAVQESIGSGMAALPRNEIPPAVYFLIVAIVGAGIYIYRKTGKGEKGKGEGLVAERPVRGISNESWMPQG